jgi:uncharacterized phage protein (TIGR01671 family)
MRQLKFRVWDNFYKDFDYIDDLYWFEGNYIHTSEDARIQQCTGIKDCNEVDIYEGDLVDFDVCISSNKGEIDSYKKQEVKYCEVNGVYVFGKDEFCMLDHIVKHTVKVTGNVFNETA